MKIIFDVDNVLADSMTCWCKKASQYTKSAIAKIDVRSHKIVGSVPILPSKIFELQDQVWKEWESLPPTESNLDRKLKILRENDFEVYIATSRPKRLTDCVLQWLDKMKIYYDSFHSLGPRQLKAKINADALVDDAPEQIQEFVRTGRVGFIYNQPWNVKAKILKAIRVRNVNDVLAHYGIRECS